MRPGDTISFLLLAIIVLLVIFILYLLLRKHKLILIASVSVLIVGYIVYIVSFPTIQEKTHEKRYNQLVAYLETHYPSQAFDITPKYLEEGYYIGEFRVNNKETPQVGVTLAISKDGAVAQRSHWGFREFENQEEIWMSLQTIFIENYTLSTAVPKIEKLDTWIKDDLTVFALDIEGQPAIAVFTFLNGGYALYKVEKGNRGGVALAEYDGHTFILIDDDYTEETFIFQSMTGEIHSFETNADSNTILVIK